MIRPHTFIVGAAPECDIRLTHPSVSGRHARLEVRGKGWRIVDVGSTNGVSVGGERVQAIDVAEGSQISFGSLPVRLGELLAQANPPRPNDGEAWTIGGDASCDLHVDFPRISGEHARIRNQSGRLWLSDLGSSNGTRTEAGPLQGEVQVRLDEPVWLGSLGMSVAELLWWHDPREAKRSPAASVSVRTAPSTPSPLAAPPSISRSTPAEPDRHDARDQRELTPARPARASPKTVPSAVPRNVFALVVLIAFLYFLFPHFRQSSIVPSALRQPEVLVNESIVLKEGEAKCHSFVLRANANVSVEVTATPKIVDVMLMTVEDRKAWDVARGSLFGGNYSHRQALSSKGVLHMAESDTIPKGEWTIVVQRPHEAALIGDDTSASVKVTVQ